MAKAKGGRRFCASHFPRYILHEVTRLNIYLHFSRFTRNSEANAPEFLTNLKEKFSRY